MRCRLVILLVVIAAAFGCGAAQGATPTIPPTVTATHSFTPIPSQDTPESTPVSIEVATILPLPTVPAAPPGAIGPDTYPADVNPLTGQAVADVSLLERRPFVVKISNAPALVRPQSGIGQADLIFEHYAEGGLTRFSAVFYGQGTDRAGSIRSARLIDYELVPMYQGLLAFSGASHGVEKRIFGSPYVQEEICGALAEDERQQCNRDVDTDIAPFGDVPPSEFAERAYKGVIYGRPYYWRDESIAVPHNMFANVNALWELAAQDGFAQRPDLHGMAFHPDPAVNAASLIGSASAVDVRYLTTLARWEYDPASGTYRRFTDGSPHTDANTGEQIHADNVVILYAGHYLTDIVESVFEDSVSYSLQITVWPQGQATLLRDGQRFDGIWVRAVREDLILLRTADGQPLYMKPGNTWFQLVPLPEQMQPTESVTIAP